MIRPYAPLDHDIVLDVINSAAVVYRGVIPDDRWKEPYMPADELDHELADGVHFALWDEGDRTLGVAGLQDRSEVALIRHVYVRPNVQRGGIGSGLLHHWLGRVDKPVLIGTWAAATWAIGFYEKHDFVRVPEAEKNALLRRYWVIPERQVDTSVVLADASWFDSPVRSAILTKLG